MPGVRVDGNDVDAVADAVGDAVARARGGGGPTLIEAVTYRWFGHYAGDRARLPRSRKRCASGASATR